MVLSSQETGSGGGGEECHLEGSSGDVDHGASSCREQGTMRSLNKVEFCTGV